MQELTLPTGTEPADIQAAFRQLEEASRLHVGVIADGFTLANVTETRTIDPTTITDANTRAFAHAVATLLSDIQKRGSTRAE
jgi:hypothetical protein